MPTKAEIIFEGAFDPRGMRTKRSIEYMEGTRSALINAETAKAVDFKRIRCPYAAGTTEHDAWYSGSNEGCRLWRINGELYERL